MGVDEASEYIDEEFEDTYEAEPEMAESEDADAALAEIEATDEDMPDEDEVYAEDDSEAGRLPN